MPALVFKATGDDPILTLYPCEFHGRDIQLVRVRLSASAGKSIRFYWSDTGVIRRQNQIELPLRADGRMHEYVFPVGEQASWRENAMKRVRLDPTDAPADVRIEYIRSDRKPAGE